MLTGLCGALSLGLHHHEHHECFLLADTMTCTRDSQIDGNILDCGHLYLVEAHRTGLRHVCASASSPGACRQVSVSLSFLSGPRTSADTPFNRCLSVLCAKGDALQPGDSHIYLTEQVPSCWQAIAALNKAMAADPNNAEVLLSLGVSYTNELDQGRALNFLTAWLSRQPAFTKVCSTVPPICLSSADRVSLCSSQVLEHALSFITPQAACFTMSVQALPSCVSTRLSAADSIKL